MTIELTNMCMIYDKSNNKVLVQNRIKSWKGISFPGGYVKEGEGIVEATIREIKEETGLTIRNLEACGFIYWYNDQTKDRYFVFNFRTYDYTGDLIPRTNESEVFWIDKDELLNLNLANGFKERLPMFFEKIYCEGFATWNEKQINSLKWF